MSLIKVKDFHYPDGWGDQQIDADSRAEYYCRELESGKILFFEDIPFDLPQEAIDFLLSQRQTGSRFHKNVSYRPKENILRGASSNSKEETERLREIMRDYSAQVTEFLGRFLAPYKTQRELDFASFRPLEEKGRDLPFKKRNDLLHVDSFPTRPTNGGRILRVFTNINPHGESRVWNITADNFEAIAGKFAAEAGLDHFAAKGSSPVSSVFRSLKKGMQSVGLPVAVHSPYDEFMLRFHDFLKENSDFQKNCAKVRLEFPARSTWLVYTDGVGHAALSGQFALEQTFIIPVDALVSKQDAPIRVLESICGKPISI